MGRIRPTVAVVDDDKSVNRAIRRLLRSIGVASDSFQTGDELLETLESIPAYRPACVILDVQTSGMQGLEVQRRLAALGISVVFTTADENPSLRDEALAAGAVAYLRRPFDDALFFKAVRIAIK